MSTQENINEVKVELLPPDEIVGYLLLSELDKMISEEYKEQYISYKQSLIRQVETIQQLGYSVGFVKSNEEANVMLSKIKIDIQDTFRQIREFGKIMEFRK